MFRYFLLFFSLIVFSQQYKNVDFITCDAYLVPNQNNKSISGRVTYEFKVINKIDTINIDAIAMEFSEVVLNGKKINFKNSGKALKLFEGFKKGKNQLYIEYQAKPKQTLYFTDENENLQIWTQGQGKNTSHWLPSFDDVNEKVIFNLNVFFEKKYKVLSNGLSQNKVLILKDGENINCTVNCDYETWKYKMQKPMSSYLVMLAIGDFVKQTDKTSSGTELEFYLDRNDSLKFEPTYRHSKQIFEFLEKEIGIKYPWEVYRQIPVRDFLYAGMENTTSTIFSQDFVVDSIGYNDKNYLNVNAHELAHQWFGDLVTATTSKHHWLQEGFATYYALLAEQSVFGDDYFYFQLWEMANQLNQAKEFDKEPILSEKASSLTFYKKGAWALHALRSDIGADNFRKAVKKYLKKYAYKNVNTDEFLAEIKKIAKDYDTENFKKTWLETPGFDLEAVQKYMNSATFYTVLQQVINSERLPYSQKREFFETLMQSDVYFPVKEEILYQCAPIPFEEKRNLIKLALATQDIKVRQAVAQSTSEIPLDFREKFESLLNDNSYFTKEIALQRLSDNFPDLALKYIEMSKNWEGLNYNLKFVNLALQMGTNGVETYDKTKAFEEMENMTQLPYDASVRQKALELLLQFGKGSDKVYKSLLEATMHYRWQFAKFGKETIRKLLKEEDIRMKYQKMLPDLNQELQERLQTFLNETK